MFTNICKFIILLHCSLKFLKFVEKKLMRKKSYYCTIYVLNMYFRLLPKMVIIEYCLLGSVVADLYRVIHQVAFSNNIFFDIFFYKILFFLFFDVLQTIFCKIFILQSRLFIFNFYLFLLLTFYSIRQFDSGTSVNLDR